MSTIVNEFHSYAPAGGHGLSHDPFNAIVAPRPIGWISSIDAQGHSNLAPYSFFNAFNYKPPVVGFSSIGWKDTVANIEATGEFVWNLTSHDLVREMNITSAAADHSVNEFELAGLATLPSLHVAALRVAHSPVQFECKLTQIVQLQNTQAEKLKTWLVLGEVVMVHIDRTMLTEGVYDTAKARPVLRAGGRGDYATVEPANMFELFRPSDDAELQSMIAELPGS